MEYANFESQIKQADDAELIVEHFISTEEKDRGGDIMRAAGMKVNGKPVVLLQHGRSAIGSEPVGKPLEIRVDTYRGKKGVIARTQFFPDETGQRLYEKVKGGYAPNFSIGYSVIEARDILKDGRFDGREVTKWELLEYSLVGVPMNPGATTFKDAETLAFKILPDGAECGCVESCKGAVKCGGHKDKRTLQFRFVDSRPPKATREEVAIIARGVLKAELDRRVRAVMGKVD